MAANTPDPTQLRLIGTEASARSASPRSASARPHPRAHPSRPDWRLSERTRQIGRQGIAEIRATLERVRPPEPDHGRRRAS